MVIKASLRLLIHIYKTTRKKCLVKTEFKNCKYKIKMKKNKQSSFSMNNLLNIIISSLPTNLTSLR